MNKKILELIKKYKRIILARHVGADPDALGATFALKEIILDNFPEKEVYVAGAEGSLLKVTDVSGRIQFTRHISGDNEAVSLSGLSDGVYFFIVEKDRQVKVYKVVKNAK